MNRARLKPWIVWLLPLLLLRAIVPMGFMLSGESGTLAFTFCSSIGGTSAVDIHAAHHHHDGQQLQSHHHHHGSEAHERSLCPYGLTGTPQVASLTVFEASPAAKNRSAPPPTSRQPTLTPSQVEPIRGPPTLA